MKTRYKVINISAVICILLGLGLIFGSFSAVSFDIYELSSEGELSERRYSYEGVTSLVINNSMRDVQLVESDDERLHVRCFNSKTRGYDVSLEDGELRVYMQDNRRWSDYILNFEPRGADLQIQLPKNFDGVIEINTKYAEITAQDISCSSIAAMTDLGNVRLYGVRTDGTVNAQTSAGNISFERIDAQSVMLHTSIGAVRGSLVGSMSDYSISSRTSVGYNNLPERSEGQRSLQVQTSAGDIDISFEGALGIG